MLIPFADVLGLTEEQAALVAVGFGGGMGRLRKNCGAYSAMVMLCGAFFGPDGAKAELRTEVYAQVQRVQRLFHDTFGTDQCAEAAGRVHATCIDKTLYTVHITYPRGYRDTYVDQVYDKFRSTVQITQ